MGVPAAVPKEPRHSRATAAETPVAFDAVDRQILHLLQTDGRIKLSELGRMGPAEPGGGHRTRAPTGDRGRDQRLRRPCRPEWLGYGIQAFIRVDPHGGYTLKHPRTLELIERPEITEVHHVVGEDCWILKTAVRDTVHLEEVLEAVSALGRTTTSIVLTSPVERKPLLP